jgi:cation:H+ antiporter
MMFAIAAIVAGLGLLVWAADRFVLGAAALARNLGVSPLLIGLTVVGFGTSAPEILIATIAALQGNPGLAVGNAIGSNIANIALILGGTALIVPLTVRSDILRKEYPVLLFASLGVYLLLFDQTLERANAILMGAALVFCLLLLIRIGRERSGPDPLADELETEIPSDVSSPAAIGWLLLGLALLILSSRLLVWGAVDIATALGVSDLVIGLTIVAVGTSLPELAASIMSALKNEPDLAIGNVIGSNLWNLLAVLTIPGLLAPGPVDPEVLQRDIPVMLGLTLALFAMGRGARTHGDINRIEGGLLVTCFIAYQGWLVWQAQVGA